MIFKYLPDLGVTSICKSCQVLSQSKWPGSHLIPDRYTVGKHSLHDLPIVLYYSWQDAISG